MYLLYGGRVDLVGEGAAAPVYATLEDAVLAEGEFFSRALHACCAKTVTHAQAFTLAHADFWAVLAEHEEASAFAALLGRSDAALEKLSARTRIAKHLKNLGKKKMERMMALGASGEAKIDPAILFPNSRFRRAWSAASLGFCVFYMLTVPLTVAFRDAGPLLYAADILVGMFFTADVALRATRFAVKRHGVWIVRPAQFRADYLAAGFALDAWAVLPLFLVAPALAGGPGAGYIKWLRLPQLLRVLRSPGYISSCVEWLENAHRVLVPTATLRIFKVSWGPRVWCRFAFPRTHPSP